MATAARLHWAAVSRMSRASSRSGVERARVRMAALMPMCWCYTISTMPSARPTNTSAQLMPRTNAGLEDAGMFARGIV
jgi:hypothetical protein